jgi:hypothetical protein
MKLSSGDVISNRNIPVSHESFTMGRETNSSPRNCSPTPAIFAIQQDKQQSNVGVWTSQLLHQKIRPEKQLTIAGNKLSSAVLNMP